MKNNLFKKLRRMAFVLIFANLFNIWPNKQHMYSHICFCMQSVAICCFDWSIWRKSSQTHSQKRELYYNSFSRWFWIDVLILNQNLTSARLLKASCNMESDTWCELWIFCYIKSHWSVFTLWVLHLLMHSFLIPCIRHLETIGSLNYTAFLSFVIFH